MHYESIIRLAFPLAAVAAAATAQSPLATASAHEAAVERPANVVLNRDFRVPVHSSEADEHGGDYGTWAAGSNYKVSFHDGMTFVPILGRDRQSESLSWRTASVQIGNRELVTRAQPLTHAADYRFEYDHGAVIEAYDVRVEGLEQTFVVKKRPTLVGDLVVRGAVTGSVELPARRALHAAVTFAGQNQEDVIGYGKAIAIDADGRAFAMTTAVQEGGVELRLPAACVEAASYPLTVDPLLTNLILDVDNDIDDVDVFCDRQETVRPIWITYSRYASATDRDLVLRRYETDFTGLGIVVYSDLTNSWSSVGGQLAAVGAGNNGRAVVVFTREYPTNNRRVRWHSHVKSNLFFNGGIGSLPHFPSTQEWRPDVGGAESTSPGETVLIVYQREDGPTFSNVGHSQVRGVKVNVMTGQTGATFAIGDAGGIDEERPAVNQIADGGSEGWIVAWQVYDNASVGAWRIAAQRIAGVSGSNGNPVELAVSTDHAITPKVAGLDGRYLLVYGLREFAGDKPLGHACRSVRSRWFWWAPIAADPSPANSSHELWADAAGQLAIGSCAADLATESHWVATYVNEQQGNEQLHVDKIGSDGDSSEHQVVYHAPNWQPTAGAASYDRHEDRFVIAFAVDNGTSSTALWASAMTYETPDPVESYGSMCGVTSNQVFLGLQRVGTYIARFSMFTLTDTVVVFGASLAPANAPLDPLGMIGCDLLIDPGSLLGTVVDITDLTGEGQVRLAIPSSMPPFELYTQWFLLVPAANPAGIASTAGMKVPFVR